MDSPGSDKPFSNMQNASSAGERELSPPPPYSEHNHFRSDQPGEQGDSSLALLPKDPPPPYTDRNGDNRITVSSPYVQPQRQTYSYTDINRDNGITVSSPYVQPQRQTVTAQPQSYQRYTNTSARTNPSSDFVGCCACTDFDGICELCCCLCCLCQVCED